mmetsp:Transcript_16760/g.28426  ORF Transcript_16760/g.28426 Transcript_16760/m.28426 type:complete len:227 (-) Transcript_16760:852-1532(-)
MFYFSRVENNETAKVTPTTAEVVHVVPTICTPQDDIEGNSAAVQIEQNNNLGSSNGEGSVVIASEVSGPTAWQALATTVVPIPRSNDNMTEREIALLELYQRSRFVRIISIIDGCFVVAFGLFNFINFILLPFPICGHFGARWWSYRLLYIYAIYLFVVILLGVVNMLYYSSAVLIALRALHVLLLLTALRYELRLAGFVLVLGRDDIHFLKESPTIKNIESRMLC